MLGCKHTSSLLCMHAASQQHTPLLGILSCRILCILPTHTSKCCRSREPIVHVTARVTHSTPKNQTDKNRPYMRCSICSRVQSIQCCSIKCGKKAVRKYPQLMMTKVHSSEEIFIQARKGIMRNWQRQSTAYATALCYADISYIGSFALLYNHPLGIPLSCLLSASVISTRIREALPMLSPRPTVFLSLTTVSCETDRLVPWAQGLVLCCFQPTLLRFPVCITLV